MATLTVDPQGKVTLQPEVLTHLGIRFGGQMEIELLPNGKATLKGARPSGSIEDFIGLLAGKTTKVATLEELEQAASDGWAGSQMNIAPDTNVLARSVVRAAQLLP